MGFLRHRGDEPVGERFQMREKLLSSAMTTGSRTTRANGRTTMLGKRMSLEEIAERLNAEKVPTIHGTNKWTAASVRKAFGS
jgi:hypothetical protein